MKIKNVELSKRDLVKANLLHGNPHWKAVFWFAVMMIASVYFSYSRAGHVPSIANILRLGALGLVLCTIVFFFISYFLVPLMVGLELKKMKINRAYDIEVTEEGISYTAENGQALHKWPYFIKKKESSDVILAYITSSMYLPIMKRWEKEGLEISLIKKNLSHL